MPSRPLALKRWMICRTHWGEQPARVAMSRLRRPPREYRTMRACRLLTAVIPTFEAHVNDPLNHRGAFNFADPAGTADWVDLTSGVTFEFRRRATLAVALVTPVTGPKPFDFEVLAQLNVRFGGGSRYGVLGP